jgi:hypothetical protein
MAKDNDREILDLPERKGEPKQRFDTFIMVFLSVLMLGTMMRIFNFPYSNVPIIIGAVGLTITYGLRFFYSPRQSLFQLLQLIFGALMVTAIVLELPGLGWGFRFSNAAMWLLIPIVILGLYSYFFKND